MGWLANRRATLRRRKELEALAHTRFAVLIANGELLVGPMTFDELRFCALYSPSGTLEIDLYNGVRIMISARMMHKDGLP